MVGVGLVPAQVVPANEAGINPATTIITIEWSLDIVGAGLVPARVIPVNEAGINPATTIITIEWCLGIVGGVWYPPKLQTNPTAKTRMTIEIQMPKCQD